MKDAKQLTHASLLGMRDRVLLLAGLTAAQDNLHGLKEAFELALDDAVEKAAELAEAEKLSQTLLARARRGDQDAISELNELRMEKIELYIRATSQFGTLFFEEVSLKNNEQAVFEHSYRNPVRIRWLAQDGGAHQVKAVKSRKQVYVDMKELHSNEVGYQMRDIQQGDDIAAASQGTVDIGWDLMNKQDVEAFNLMAGGTINGQNYGTSVWGAFVTTGTPLSRTFIAHPRIQLANLPTTNVFVNTDLDDGGSSNLFRLAVIRKIMAYCDAWGNVFGAPIRPTGAILIPSSESTQLAQEIKPTGTFYNQVAEKILSTYTRFSYMGVEWTLIPDVTIPPGACYPVLSRPVGRRFVKPGFAQEFVESNPRKNWETRSAMVVLNFTIQEPWRVNTMRVTYSSAAGAGVVTTND